MDFDRSVAILNGLLSEKNPEAFNRSWILRHAPRVYRFIWKNIRTEIGTVDWDRVTYAIEWKFQRRWAPGKRKKNPVPYENSAEVEAILKKYEGKTYVFVAPVDLADRRVRDIMSISLVRLAQNGNLSAKEELMKLLGYTIADWLERFYSIFCPAGRDTMTNYESGLSAVFGVIAIPDHSRCIFFGRFNMQAGAYGPSTPTLSTSRLRAMPRSG